MAASQHKKYFSPRKRSIYIALIYVCSSTSLHTSTWLCLAAATPILFIYFFSLPCWWGTQGHQVPAASPCAGTIAARLSQASCMISPLLSERLEVLPYLSQPSVKSSPEHFNPGRKRDQQKLRSMRRNTLWGSDAPRHAEQGARLPWQRAVTFRSTE